MTDSLKALIPSEYYWPVVLLLLLIAGLIFASLFWRSQRYNYVLAIVVAILLLVVMRAAAPDRWSWMLGLLPTLLVGYQAFYLWSSQPKETNSPPTLGAGDDTLKVAHERAKDNIASQYNIRTLFVRYGFPAALLGIIGIVILNATIKPGNYLSLITFLSSEYGRGVVRIDWRNVDKILLGLRLGAVGAYVYVLLELGRRTFRHDVTGTSAMWCVVTLVLGPMLAALVAVLWKINSTDPQGNTWWAGGVVLFFAGYAPRRVISAIEQAAIQLLKIGGSGVVPTRQIPLTQVRGISPQIEERLSEEGIDDVNALAAAEPIRLLRNTSFDLRQILTWIDEAILIVTLPRSWQALEEEGITGAIDLAWLGYDPAATPQVTPDLKALLTAERDQVITELAEKSKTTPTSLKATILRLQQDRQVQDIWALYNGFTESLGEPGTGDGGSRESAVPHDGGEPG